MTEKLLKATLNPNKQQQHNLRNLVIVSQACLLTNDVNNLEDQLLLYPRHLCQGVYSFRLSVRLVAELLALRTSDHRVMGSNPAGGKILPKPKRHFIAQSLSCSPFHRLEMIEILLKRRKTLTHPSISVRFPSRWWNCFKVLCSSSSSGVYLTNHSSESIHI